MATERMDAQLHSSQVFENAPVMHELHPTAQKPLTLAYNFYQRLTFAGARGGAVCWGTALQAEMSRVRFPMVSLEFFIDIILPATPWPWGRVSF